MATSTDLESLLLTVDWEERDTLVPSYYTPICRNVPFAFHYQRWPFYDSPPITDGRSFVMLSAKGNGGERRRYGRHVDFTFGFGGRRLIEDREGEAYKSFLYSVFPETWEVKEYTGELHRIFKVGRLPEAPWPLTVCGKPYTLIGDSGRGRVNLFPREMLGTLDISILEDWRMDDAVTDEKLRKLGREVHAWFAANLPGRVRVTELMITAENTMYLFVPSRGGNERTAYYERAILPGKIAGYVVRYVDPSNCISSFGVRYDANGEEEPTDPNTDTDTDTLVDATEYVTLRPGVLVSGKKRKEVGDKVARPIPTTAGVCVKNAQGEHFLTLASHAIGDRFPLQQAEWGRFITHGLLHPRQMPAAGICLVPFNNKDKDKDGGIARFVNKPFDDLGYRTPTLSRLAASTESFEAGRGCFMDTPYTGSLEGCLVAKSVKLLGLQTDNIGTGLGDGSHAAAAAAAGVELGVSMKREEGKKLEKKEEEEVKKEEGQELEKQEELDEKEEEEKNTKDEPPPGHAVVYNWSWMGQMEGNDDPVVLPSGTRGSVVWDKDGVVRGFHAYYVHKGPWRGFAVSLSASELVEAGYTLA